MRLPLRIAAITWLGVFVAVSATGLAQRAAPPATSPAAGADATARIVAAAQAVLATLDDAGRAKVQFPFDGPQKTRWSNLPSASSKREGLRMGDLTPAQRTAVRHLLSTALSRDGYRKVTEIMRGDEVLRTTGAARAAAGSSSWGWRSHAWRSGAAAAVPAGAAAAAWRRRRLR